jgi:hypothetical protein
MITWIMVLSIEDITFYALNLKLIKLERRMNKIESVLVGRTREDSLFIIGLMIIICITSREFVPVPCFIIGYQMGKFK